MNNDENNNIESPIYFLDKFYEIDRYEFIESEIMALVEYDV